MRWEDASAIPLDHEGPRLAFTPFDLVLGPERPLLAQVVDRLRSDPNRVFLDDGTRRLTGAELEAEVGSLAAAIADKVPMGAPVGVRLPDCASTPVAWLACLAAGCPAVLLDPADGAERFTRIAETSRLAAVITDRPEPGHVVITPRGDPPAPLSASSVDSGAPAFVVWTSGSTGQPKGIVHSQRSVLYRAGLLINTAHLCATDRYLSLNTASGMGGLLNAVAAFLAGACLHRVDIAEEGLTGVLSRIKQTEITAMIAAPALYRALCRIDGAAAQLASLRVVSSNGEALLAADLGLLRSVLPESCAVQMVYGATETQAAMRFVPASERPDGPQVAAGRPVPGTQWAILDDSGLPVPAGEVGELWIRSRYTAIGEWVDGTCMRGRLTPDGADGFRRYAVGDLVRVREDGAFVVLGRKDRQLKIDGFRVDPVEVEAVLRGDPDVLDAAVIPLTDRGSTRLVAFAAVGGSPSPDLAVRLRGTLAARLPAAMRPRKVHLLEVLPLLPGNKIDAEALRLIDSQSRPRR